MPFFDRVARARTTRVAAVARARTPRTAALYVSYAVESERARASRARGSRRSPSWARRADLWLISDEVYEDFVYRGEHVSIARFAPERTLSVFSFSKAYGMAGNRTGYLVGPRGGDRRGAQDLRPTRSTPRRPPAQFAALARAARRRRVGRATRARATTRSAAGGRACSASPPPEGSTFLFLDVRRSSTSAASAGFLEDCVADGVALAPGASSGRDYANWVRLCYTAAPPDQVLAAVDRLAVRLR